jgi:uncharacterized protein with NRDE domain
MCTIGVLFRSHPSVPLLLAHNRDEMRGRASRGVTRWTPDEAEVDVVGGRDEVSGGSWLLIGPALVAAVTNHHRGQRSPPGARSRGELVARCASASSLGAAETWLDSLTGADFGGFHLLVTDGERMLWATNADDTLALAEVAPGAHALRNTTLDDPDDAITAFVIARMQQVADAGWRDALPQLQDMLAVAAPAGPCVDLGFYGTRSAGVLAWGNGEGRYVATDRPPPEGGWNDHSALLR